MKMQTYTIAHGPAKVITVVTLPAFSTPKSVTMVGTDIKLSVMTPTAADPVDELFVTYETGTDIEHFNILEFVGSCVDAVVGDIWHVFHVPPRYIRYFIE